MSINTKEQNINELFSINKQYHIDFYQRDYKWRKEHIEKLLEDLFYRFGLEYKPDGDVTEEAISKYDWYYLNAYVANEYNGNTYIVDGQQRLTSITLILIKLYHLAKQFEIENLTGFLEAHIAGKTLTGHKFWMGHNNRNIVLEDLLLNGKQAQYDTSGNDISVKNLYDNYLAIDKMMDSYLTSAHKLQAFSIYFLYKVMLVKTDIQNTKDVPMVFEVINDRGERLKPYEVLKGKLLGQIEKPEVDTYHSIWQQNIHEIQKVGEEQVDNFLRFLFRSRYVDSPAEYREFDGEYHKTIYEPRWDKKIQLKQNIQGVKNFVNNEFKYYATLYLKIFNDSQRQEPKISPHLMYNDLNDQDRQYLLIMSACCLNDAEEFEKIKLVSRLFDKHFTILQLMGSYDSNQFSESVISLNKQIRNKSSKEIEEIYNTQIINDIAGHKHSDIKKPLEWNYFKEASNNNLGIRFIRYYFARIEHFIAESIKMPTESYYNLVRNTGSVSGHHVEHILANNEENMRLFNNDEELFFSERNKLGALLLLKGKDNQSSGNEPYYEKLKTYSGTLLWNQTLCSDFYHKKLDFENFNKNYGLNIKTYDIFDKQAVDDRQQILFKLTNIIWA